MQNRVAFLLIFAAATLGAAPAAAEDEFCVDRPGANTPPCTLAPGRLMAEVSAVDWTLDRSAEERTDTILAADLLLRLGLADATEARLGFSPYGHSRTRNRITDAIGSNSGVGDVTIGLRHGLAGRNGPVAVQVFLTLPTGSQPVGDGTWSAGILVPLEFTLSEGITFAATPEIDAAANESGDGRHLSYGSAAGIAFALGDTISAATEFIATRDDDPQDPSTTLLLSQSLAWQLGGNAQFDMQGLVGLNRATPDLQLIVGVARLF